MNPSKRTTIFLVAGVLAIGTVLGMTIQSVISEDNTYQNLQKLNDAFATITKRYVEDVDSSKLSRDAIEGMLEGLDPHSVFIDAERMQDVRENFSAAFEGIGISYEWTEGVDGADTLTVLNPIVGGPSEEAGLRPGDRIINVGDRSTIGWEREDVERYLKGPKGTKVTVTVKRPLYDKMLDFTITRDQIPIYTVDAFHMVDERTGYIKLNRFARTTYEEVQDALVSLKEKGMERLVFDLRGNPGGYMNMAIRVADEFLNEDQMIVFTKSRHTGSDEQYHATARGTFEESPVIMLVDQNSASASEIVAGALQDHDRALIVGRRTFGKGLVQQQFPLPDGSVLQLTTSRYYTPVGRLIQTPYEPGRREEYYRAQHERAGNNGNADVLGFLDLLGEDEDVDIEGVTDVSQYLSEVPDSLKFQTDKGRVVLGGGGILPDFIVTSKSSDLMRDIIWTNMDHNFVRDWMEKHPELRDTWETRQEEFNRTYKPSRDFTDAFWAYAKNEYNLHIVADEEAKPETDEESEEVYHTVADVEADQAAIETRLKAYVARRLWGVSAWYPVIHNIDPVFIEAMRLWERAESLSVAYQHQ